MTDQERLDWVARATLRQLLEKWRFEPMGSPWMDGDVGKKISLRLVELRKEDPVEWTRASKQLGWERPRG